MSDVDLIVPVYNEGENIIPVLQSIDRNVKTPCRVLICYDWEGDTTLAALAAYRPASFTISLIRNTGRGPHAAVMAGFAAATAPAVIVFPADDSFNAPIVDDMVGLFRQGSDVVCASRFMKGGTMQGCPFPKNVCVRAAAFSLYHLARLPTHDPTNGFRLFSRRVVKEIPIESTKGFTYSLELLVKCHRLGWKVAERPAVWHERVKGKSRFRLLDWLSAYLRWYFYAFMTTYFRRGPSTVHAKIPSKGRGAGANTG